MSGPESQSYLSKLSPFTRSPTVQPSKGKDGEPEPLVQQQPGTDHRVRHRHRLSLRNYPRDCPPLRPQWFHAVDSPKRRPNPAGKTDEKLLPAPKKYAAFSVRDSKAIEVAYRKLGEELEAAERQPEHGDLGSRKAEDQQSKEKPNVNLKDDLSPGKVRVPVNEDYLFDVDIERRELGPAYWLGPVYDVRRGTWFYQDGSVQRPCDENLATQLEDGYLKVEAWKLASQQAKQRSASQPRKRPTSWGPDQLQVSDEPKPAASAPMTPKLSSTDLRKQAADNQLPVPPGDTEAREGQRTDQPQNTYRLFGAHMNSVVTYQDANTAWLLTDDFMSRMNYTMYQRFAGGGHYGGIKLVRGYAPETKKPESKDNKATTTEKDTASKDSAPASEEDPPEDAPERPSVSETHRQKLERHMSSLLEEATSPEDQAKQEEELRKRDEREMEEDYQLNSSEDQGREVEHLILVTHGIGQRLGLRIESVNFVHDVNTFRKTIKAVYADSPDLKALNAELDNAEVVNSRVQVLPICWRHLLDFPKQSLKHNRKEADIADTDQEDEDYPSLEDISVEGVPAVRNLITDLALDILLYQSPAYKDHISRIVLEECNRIYHLFMERNPNFKGKISMIGHSLGSAIMFDILCRQDQQLHPSKQHRKHQHHLKLDFEVEDFYALGSPIGLFQMLTGRTIAAREGPDGRKRAMTTSMDDPMLSDIASASTTSSSKTTRTPLDRTTSTSDLATSNPKCAQLFNIFHPTDPISYRIEPLISPTMATLKPQPLPYTKRGIFGAPMGQGLTGIGARVSQSVSSMWTSMASNLLTRGLGYSGGEAAQVPSAQQNASIRPNAPPPSSGAGTNVSAGVIPTAPPPPPEGSEIAAIPEKIASGAVTPTRSGQQHPPTLIDSEIETLYAGYQKHRGSVQGDAGQRDLGAGAVGSPEWQESEERAKRLKREEEKVRRLNSNGRVDYAIQEGAFDINLIAAIASHLSYWSDEDVSHFIISQLLSRHRVVRPRRTSGGSQAAGRDS
ncbi:uncharacterized protein LTR77_006469 [Saxophila tyrrhenica]|uniref:DDHD domain-containing protein n=1 Tax=Saxophila tyrrhenica TaxID=1690608 RepID=A0AAV9PC53_9PEZI|nr:hypothetical protein LTR77_006469 [Saxophila tyrrhenica]